jgi:hypothetical protein
VRRLSFKTQFKIEFLGPFNGPKKSLKKNPEFNPSSPITSYFIILLCLTPDNFTHQGEMAMALNWLTVTLGLHCPKWYTHCLLTVFEG